MSSSSKAAALRQIRSVFAGGAVAGLSDAHLLERFASRPGDEAAASAFAALIERHGPMVRRTCRAALGNEHDAQDAFQAVFLTLARKAKTLWVRDSLAPWLHGVAVRAAARMRVARARRRRHERRLAEMAPAGAIAPAGDDGLVPLLHEEIDRLPIHYRSALILCDLQGLTHEQAASHLGCPIGTVKSRQSRARERLIRRGIAPSAALTALVQGGGSASASIPVGWREAALASALRVAAGGPAASGFALARALGRDAVQPPSWIRIGRIAVAFLALVGSAAGFLRLGLNAPILASLAPVTNPGPRPVPTSAPPASAPVDPPASVALQDSQFAIRLAADTTHDAEAVRQAIGTRDLDHPPDGYTWLPVGEESVEGEGLIIRDAISAGPTPPDRPPSRRVLVRDTPGGVNGRDLYEIADIGDRETVFLRFSDGGMARFADLADGRLREDGGTTTSRLAVIVGGEVVATTAVRHGRRHALAIGPRPDLKPVLGSEHHDQLLRIAKRNQSASPSPKSLPCRLPDPDPLRRAYTDAIQKLEWAQRVVITMADRDGPVVVDRAHRAVINQVPVIVDVPGRVVNLVPPGLFVHESVGERGRQVATLTFERDNAVLGTFLVFENGEWAVQGQPGRLAAESNLDLERFFDRQRRAPRDAE